MDSTSILLLTLIIMVSLGIILKAISARFPNNPLTGRKAKSKRGQAEAKEKQMQDKIEDWIPDQLPPQSAELDLSQAFDENSGTSSSFSYGGEFIGEYKKLTVENPKYIAKVKAQAAAQQAAAQQTATPQMTTRQMAAPQAATPQAATPQAATPQAAAPQVPIQPAQNPNSLNQSLTK